MNLELLQLLNTLTIYKKALSEVNGYRDPEYLAWVSVNIDQDQWPGEGSEFDKARQDNNFRKFRTIYKELYTVMQMFQWGELPTETRLEYYERYKKENPEGVPI